MNKPWFGLTAIAALVLGLVGLFVRPDHGVDAMPGYYPLVGIAIVAGAIALVRLLTRVLQRPEDYYDAD
ncbi:MAG: hypothetical protein RQ729_01305 [Wenzhouxiangellaceae bacterium]|nr:hypothetical protein [Wenzhouxiangellaceae bacterium]